ncbi:MAG: hypothetical protein JOY80_13030 [Candidatus Dormibacteraeota bacterium]|nr:hypothetical protein [Candidatus Dormibacteraeota bacterium]
MAATQVDPGSVAPVKQSTGRRIVPLPAWALAAAGLFATLPFITRRVGDPDYWWQTLTGRLIFTNHSLVRTDLYTYTVPGAHWTDHEYGMQLIFYGLTRVGGLLLVSVFFAFVVWVGFAFVLARMRERQVSWLVAGATLVLGAGAGFAVWGPRSQMVDFAFLGLELWFVERFLSGKGRAFYFMPLVVLIWANLHGGFVFAFYALGVLLVTLAVRWLWEGRSKEQLALLRRAALVTVGCVVASLVTPWGPSLFIYVFRTQFSSQQSSFIAEWASPDFHMTDVLGFEIMLLLILVGFMWRRPRLYDVLLVVSGIVLALHAVRFIEIFVVVAAPIVAWQWSAAWERLRTWVAVNGRWPAATPTLRDGVVMASALVCVASVGFAAYTLRGQTASTNANYPVAAADWLEAHPNVGTRVFNQYDWGGYLAYRFYPESSRRVFIYGEAELMGDALLAQYVEVNQLHSDWEQVLDSYGVDYVVFAADRPLDTALQASSTWMQVYADGVADIFVRRSAAPAGLTPVSG